MLRENLLLQRLWTIWNFVMWLNGDEWSDYKKINCLAVRLHHICFKSITLPTGKHSGSSIMLWGCFPLAGTEKQVRVSNDEWINILSCFCLYSVTLPCQLCPFSSSAQIHCTCSKPYLRTSLTAQLCQIIKLFWK